MNLFSRILYRAKAWLEAFAGTRHALPVLFLVAFIEASVFPVPPDILFVALAAMCPPRSFLYASVCIAGSVAGAFLGYWIGYALFENIGQQIVNMLGMGNQFASVLVMYHDNAWPALLLAGFTTIPFSVFTIAAGFRRTLDPVTLGLASLAGRAVRFYLVGGLLYFFGPAMKRYLDRYLPAAALIMLGLFVLVFVVVRGLF